MIAYRTVIVGALLCVAAWLFGPRPASPEWIGPLRPLSDSEWLALHASKADGIVVARVLQIKETTTVGREDIDFNDLTLQPSRWLKGRGSLAELHVRLRDSSRVFVDTATGQTYERSFPEAGTGKIIERSVKSGELVAGIFFLRLDRFGWSIDDYPAPLRNQPFVRLTDSVTDTSEMHAVEVIVARQSLDSLLTRADLVILGHKVEGTYRSTGGPGLACDRVGVDSVLVGSVPRRAIWACSPELLPYPCGRAVFFLRWLSSDQYEYIDFHAGFVPVEADTLVPFGVPLKDVFRRAAQLHAHGLAR